MTLFDQEIARSVRYAEEAEPIYNFLNTSDRPDVIEIRNLLENWYTDLPDPDQDLCSRFRSLDDEQHKGAFWELYTYRYLSGIGSEVHRIQDDTKRTPDFEVECNHLRIFTECTVELGRVQDRLLDKVENEIIDYINRTVKSPDHFISMTASARSKKYPKIRKLAADIQEQLSRKPETFMWKNSGWKIRVHFVAKQDPKRDKTHDRPIGGRFVVRDFDSNMVSQKLAQSLHNKASAYGDIPEPYLIFVNIDHHFFDHIDESNLEDALFGSLTVSGVRTPNGLWMGPTGQRATRVSGVVAAFNIKPWTMATNEPVLWHNPWASNPIEKENWRGKQVRFDIKSRIREEINGIAPHIVLDIEERFPQTWHTSQT